jgi:hypothetical protein
MVNQQFPLIAVIITVAPPLIKRFHFFIPNGDELSTASVERSKDRRKINAMFEGVCYEIGVVRVHLITDWVLR